MPAIVLGVDSAAPAQNREVFIGTWERISNKDAEGRALDERLLPSTIIFAADGHYSQTGFPSGRDRTSKPVREMTREELVNRLDGVVSGYGTYTVTGNRLTRRVLQHLNPSSQGTEIVQEFVIAGDTVTLKVLSDLLKNSETVYRRVK
jgi:hypothetical protein